MDWKGLRTRSIREAVITAIEDKITEAQALYEKELEQLEIQYRTAKETAFTNRVALLVKKMTG